MKYKNWPEGKKLPAYMVVEDGWVIPEIYSHYMPPKGMMDRVKAETGSALVYLTDGEVYNLISHQVEDE